VTQPALTKAIHKLELEFGGELFERERKRIELTELGQLILPTLERAMAAAEAARAFAREFASHEIAPLRLGLAPSISAGLTARPLAELWRRISGVCVDLVESSGDGLVESLLEAKLHAAITGETNSLADRIDHWPLFEESILVAMAPRHALARHRLLPLAALAETAWLCQPGCDLWIRFSALRFPGAAPEVEHWASRSGHLASMAIAGLGVFLLPQHVPAPAGLVTRRIEGDPLRRQVHLLTIAGRRYSPALDGFVKIARVIDWSQVPDRENASHAPRPWDAAERVSDAQPSEGLPFVAAPPAVPAERRCAQGACSQA
jgi:DNA-binding transcriptional LysR family regulator